MVIISYQKSFGVPSQVKGMRKAATITIQTQFSQPIPSNPSMFEKSDLSIPAIKERNTVFPPHNDMSIPIMATILNF